eukprot:2063972-Amphidinium_carterae.2
MPQYGQMFDEMRAVASENMPAIAGFLTKENRPPAPPSRKRAAGAGVWDTQDDEMEDDTPQLAPTLVEEHTFADSGVRVKELSGTMELFQMSKRL